ncbi:hypothetical protein BDV18DRAFT_158361 [Aspergillus unguis]
MGRYCVICASPLSTLYLREVFTIDDTSKAFLPYDCVCGAAYDEEHSLVCQLPFAYSGVSLTEADVAWLDRVRMLLIDPESEDHYVQTEIGTYTTAGLLIPGNEEDESPLFVPAEKGYAMHDACATILEQVHESFFPGLLLDWQLVGREMERRAESDGNGGIVVYWNPERKLRWHESADRREYPRDEWLLADPEKPTEYSGIVEAAAHRCEEEMEWESIEESLVQSVHESSSESRTASQGDEQMDQTDEFKNHSHTPSENELESPGIINIVPCPIVTELQLDLVLDNIHYRLLSEHERAGLLSNSDTCKTICHAFLEHILRNHIPHFFSAQGKIVVPPRLVSLLFEVSKLPDAGDAVGDNSEGEGEVELAAAFLELKNRARIWGCCQAVLNQVLIIDGDSDSETLSLGGGDDDDYDSDDDFDSLFDCTSDS